MTADGLSGNSAAADYFYVSSSLRTVASLGRTGTDKKDSHNGETDECFLHNSSLSLHPHACRT
jgi:hypothetical protein